MSLPRNLLARVGLRYKIAPLIRRFVDGRAYAEHLKSLGYRIGEDCSIPPGTILPPPGLVRIGNNVRFSAGVALLHYDGSIAMIGRQSGLRLDAVAPVVIRDNVQIGMRSIVVRGVVLGPNVVVGCNSSVTKDLSNAVVAGSPAAPIRSYREHVERLRRENDVYPWRELILSREGGFDASLEPELNREREAFFFGPEGDLLTPRRARPRNLIAMSA